MEQLDIERQDRDAERDAVRDYWRSELGDGAPGIIAVEDAAEQVRQYAATAAAYHEAITRYYGNAR